MENGNNMDGGRRIAMEVQYDGTDFLGWQRQASGRTVQEELERMLGRVCGDRPVTVVGAGRTDAGVHAHGQTAHADVSTRYDDADLAHALRRMTSADLAVVRLNTVSDDFHARFAARKRSYRYSVLFRPNPFRARYAWHPPVRPDIERMHAGASALIGTHDFTALSKHNPDTADPVCTIHSAEWRESEDGLEFHITATRFLYGMVRLLVGIQYDIGRGVREAEEIPEVLESRDRARQSMAVPAQGLSLYRVEYEGDPFRT